MLIGFLSVFPLFNRRVSKIVVMSFPSNEIFTKYPNSPLILNISWTLLISHVCVFQAEDEAEEEGEGTDQEQPSTTGSLGKITSIKVYILSSV